MKLPALLLTFLLSISGAFAQDEQATGVLLLTPRVKIALNEQKHKALKGSTINVDTNVVAHTITLSGITRSVAQKTLAGAIARRQAGTFQVRNRLLVRGGQPVLLPQMGIPVQVKRTSDFLQLLAKSQGRNDGIFGEEITPFPDVKRLLTFVSARGITIVDFNENLGKPLVMSREQLGRDLRRTGSSAFESFAFLGYMVAMPYAQKSRPDFKTTKDGVIVEMPTGHRLKWQREKGRLQLCRLEYGPGYDS